MKRWIVMLPCALAAGASAQPARVWLDQFGTAAIDIARALAPDGAGGVFVAGHTDGSLGGMGAGGADAFLARYDSAGGRTWLVQFGTAQYDDAFAVAPAAAGGVFVAGTSAGDLGGPNAGGQDAFVARYDDAGNRMWIAQFGTAAIDVARALAPDGSGGVILAGQTGGGLGGAFIGGASDVFLARYDDAGNQTWIVQLGTHKNDYPSAVAPDGAGGAFVTGFTSGNLGGTNAGQTDAFLARYDAAGNRSWVKLFGTAAADYGNALVPDGAGGVFVAGSTGGDLGGPLVGLSDGFVARYTAAGHRTWITQFGSDKNDYATALAPDGSGGAFVAGYTQGSLGGPPAGSDDVFIAEFAGGGNQEWATQFGTAKGDDAFALAPDGGGGAFISGFTEGDLGGPSAGGLDAFLARYGAAACYPDCTGDGALDLFDFLCFVNDFNLTGPYSNCDGNGSHDLFDFLCFVNAFNAGC